MSRENELSRRQFIAAASTMVVAASLCAPGAAQAQELVADSGEGLFEDDAEPVEQEDDLDLTAQSSVDLTAGASLVNYYKPILQRAQSGSLYTLFDIDNNGIPELLVLDNTGTAGRDNMHVYTVNSSGVRSCGSTSGIASYTVCGSSNGTLYLCREHMSSFMIWKVTLKNGYVSTSVAFSNPHAGSSIEAFLANAAEYEAFRKKNGIVKLETASVKNYALLSRYAVVHRSSGARTMWRLYNRDSGEHFYTADANERNAVAAAGWTYERMGWVTPTKSKTPVYRLYNPYAGDHHYTMSAAEKNSLVKIGWKNEGVGWYSDDSKRTPLYREYNPNQFACNHNYTTSKSEHNSLVKLGWKDEGIGWYGI